MPVTLLYDLKKNKNEFMSDFNKLHIIKRLTKKIDDKGCLCSDIVSDVTSKILICKRVIYTKEGYAIMSLTEINSHLDSERNKSIVPYEFLYSFMENDKFSGLFDYIDDGDASDVISVTKDLSNKVNKTEQIFEDYYFSLGEHFAYKFNEYVIYKLISNKKLSLRLYVAFDYVRNFINENKKPYFEAILILDTVTKKELMKKFPNSVQTRNAIDYFEDVKLIEINSKQLKNIIIMIEPELVYCHYNEFQEEEETKKNKYTAIKEIEKQQKIMPSFRLESNHNFITISALMDIGLSFPDLGYKIFKFDV